MTPTPTDTLAAMSDDALQDHLLQGVSRTFALTIPQLPEGLYRPVANAYLLCRIVDTIEDEACLDSESKRRFCADFSRVVRGQHAPEALRAALAPRLSEKTLPAEHELIAVLPRVIAITHGFDTAQREALSTCVEIMSEGMARFQGLDLRQGLATLKDHNDYCYVVAGVVGEMLTRLFCHYSLEIRTHEAELLRLAISFGQGLQMTNILKDLWEDHGRGVSWLPREVFERHGGFALESLQPGQNDPRFLKGYADLIGIAHGHLENALRYTLLIPAHETGIRAFCLWALGMAILTLRKISKHPGFSQSADVKISRRAVKATILTTRLLRASDVGLKTAFKLAGRGVPRIPQPT